MVSPEPCSPVKGDLNAIYWTQLSPMVPFGINLTYAFKVELKSHFFYKEVPDSSQASKPQQRISSGL